MSRITVNLIDETPSDPLIVKGWESFVFTSGDFGGGKMVTEYSPDNGVTWFPDAHLTFDANGFETFRAAPSILYRFRANETRTTPSLTVVVA